MSLHKLLQKQISRYIDTDCSNSASFNDFIESVDASYKSFERDKSIMNHAFKMSEDEYRKVNEDLSSEYNLKRLSIEKLKEGLRQIAGESSSKLIHENESLLPIVDYLNSEISKRKEVENDLSRTLLLFRTLLSNLHSGILVEDENRKILFTNQQFCSLFSIHFKPEEMTGFDCEQSAQQVKTLFKDPEAFVNLVDKLLINKKPAIGIELEMLNEITLSLDYVPIYIGNKFVGQLWDYTDISERKKTERYLLNITNVQHTILNGTNYSIIYTDAQGIIRSFNRGAEEMLGYKATEVIGKHTPAMFHSPAQVNERAASLSQSLGRKIEPGFEVFVAKTRQGVVDTQEWIYRTKNNQELTVLLSVSSLRDSSNEIIGFLGIARDISEQKKAETALKITEERYKNIVEKSTDIIYKTNKGGSFTFVNPVAQRITEYSENELLNMNYLDLIHEDYRTKTKKFYLSQFIKKTPSTYLEFPIHTKSNKLIWIEQSVQLSTNEMNEVEMIALAIDISKQKQSEAVLRAQEEKYRNIIANMHLGLLEVAPDERIQFANQGFCSMSGYTEKELIGKKASELFVKGENREILNKKNESRFKGESDSYEIRLKNKRGEMKWWMISGAPNYNDEGKLVGSIGIHLDITEQKKLEEELELAKKKAEDASKAKESFLANMSHEIRTPLNAINGMIRELNKENLSAQQRTYVDNSYKASGHLMSIINNILDISKIEAGELCIEQEHFILANSLSKVFAMLNSRAEEKGIYLKYEIANDISEVLVGDSLRIEQILVNLLSNAIKFTSVGGITISCKLLRNDDKKQKIEITVRDTGIGMDGEYLKTIFSKFSQEDKSTSRKFGGTGLGMAITYELVQLMDGSIEVSSEKNIGTAFCVKLVLGKGKAENIKSHLPLSAITNLAGTEILLVEDNEMNRLVAQNTLKYYQCKVTEAVDGQDAIEQLSKKTFDVILMDIQMPGMDGIEATKYIRNQMKINTPIIALTANAFKSEIELCRSIGMNEYVTKPFEENVLIETISKLKGQTGQVRSAENIQTKDSSSSLFNLSRLKHTSRGDDDFVNKMIALFIEQAEECLNQANSALNAGNYPEISRLVHKLKPSLDNMGFDSIKEKVRELERISKNEPGQNKIPVLLSEISSVIYEGIKQLRPLVNK